MKQPEPEARALAALLDGCLDARARERLVRQLGESDDALALLGDAATALRELEHDAPPAVVGSTVSDATAGAARGGRSWTRWRVAALAAAALLIGAVGLPTALRVARGGGAPTADYTTLLAEAGSGLPEGWNGTPWSAARGAGAPVTEMTRATRVGARWADFELLARAGDPRAAATGAELLAMLEEVPGAGPAVAVVERMRVDAPRGTRAAGPALDHARAAVIALVDAEMAEIAMWVESARVATRHRDAAFFRHRESRQMLERIAGHPAVRAAAPDAPERLTALATLEPLPDWEGLSTELAGLLRALGG